MSIIESALTNIKNGFGKLRHFNLISRIPVSEMKQWFKKMVNSKILNNRNRSLVVKFMVSYLIILGIPVLIGTLIYKEAIKIVEADVESSNLSMLKQTRDIIDQQIESIEILKNQIGMSPQLNLSLQDSPVKGPEFYFEMRKLMDQLRPFGIGGNLMHSFFIYMKKPNYIISPTMAYDADFFFEKVFKMEGVNRKKWLYELNRYYNGFLLPASRVTLESKQYLLIPYVHSLPTIHYRRVEGAIVFLLKAEAIHKLLSPISSVKGGWVFVTDSNNQIITGLPRRNFPSQLPAISDQKTEGFNRSRFWGEKMIISYTTSSYNGWKYISVLPSRAVMQKVIYIKRIVWGFIVLSLLIGALIAYLMTARNIEPLKKILNLIKDNLDNDTDKEKDAFQYLQGSISQLINNNQSLQETIKNYTPIIRTAFFERLLRGGFNNESQIEAVSSYLGIQITGDYFLVLLLRIFGQDDIINREIIEESNLTKAVLMETLAKYIDGKGYLHDLDQNNIAILMVYKNSQAEECFKETETLVKTIAKEIRTNFKLKVQFAGGNVSEKLLDVWQSFQEAVRTLDYQNTENCNPIIWYNEISKQGTEYYYPIDFEQRLINFVKAGELKQVENLIRTIYRENIETRQLSPEMNQALIYELKGTVVKVCSQAQLKNEEILNYLNEIDVTKPFGENYEKLVNVYQTICKKVIGNRKFHNVQLKEKIISFINRSYQQPDLSLHKIASQFGLSEGYLSHFFKDQVGENFLAYLEGVRIRQACELLNDTELSINEIAEQVGYNSVHTFRRAFKRVKGVNPTSFKSV